MEADTQPATEVGDERRVAVGLGTAQVKVAVGGLDRMARCPQQVQQRHGVGSTAQRHEQRGVRGDGATGAESEGGLADERVHGAARRQ